MRVFAPPGTALSAAMPHHFARLLRFSNREDDDLGRVTPMNSLFLLFTFGLNFLLDPGAWSSQLVRPKVDRALGRAANIDCGHSRSIDRRASQPVHKLVRILSDIGKRWPRK
jgi:hypothetical protein